jgi:hypothetical protein
MNGFGGRKGGIVDQLFLQCVPDSAPTQASATQGPGIGGNGGTAFSSFYCPDGSYVNGVSGGNGWPTYPTALASFKVTCSDNSATQSNVSYSVQGTTAYQYTCPAGQKAIGVDAGATTGGAYAGFVNGIICQ